MAVFGFGISLCLVAIGLLKVLLPDAVGVWSASNGNSIIITFSEHSYGNSAEIFGYWLIPVAIFTGLALAVLTKRVLKVLKQNL